jgi:outer membrane protein assembly factor BamB/serine/threonine protein kinase
MLPLGVDDPRVIGEFRLHAQLGAGGMGRVFLASSPGGREVAVKVVHPYLARDDIFRGRFRREVAAARAVNGGYAAPVIAAGPDDDPPWLATAYVPGPSLQEAVTATGPLPEDAALKLAAGLAEALRAIHACGLVHRDLKPGNVLLATDGPHVIDFGIARALDGTVLTAAESALDTPFMSPEQAQGLPTGPASDVFSLGGVVYFAATGDGPFGTGHPAVMLYRIMHTEPDLDRLPPGLRDLAAACLAKDPARRPAPAELATALTGSARPGNSPEGFWPAPIARLIADHQSRPPADPPSAAAEPRPAVDPPSAAEPPRVGPSRAAPSPAEPPTEPQPVEPQAAEPPTEPQPIEPHAAAPPEPEAAEPQAAEPQAAEPQAAEPEAAEPQAAEPQTAAALSGPEAAEARPHEPPPAVPLPAELLPTAAAPAPPAEATADTGPPREVGRRRALATLAGVAAGGLAVAGWELIRPSPLAPGTRRLAARRALPPHQPGAKIWSYPVGGPVEAVAAAGPIVFAGTGENSVYALNATTGALIWRREITHAVHDQLVLAGNNVIIGDGIGGGVYALEATTGRQRWRVSSGAVRGLAAAGGVVYAGFAVKSHTTGGVTALSADRGQVVWTVEFGRKLDTTGGLAVSRGVVYLTTSHGEIYAFRAADGRRLWRIAGRNVTFGSAPPVVAGGVVYASSGNKIPVLYAVHAATGRGRWHRALGAAAFPAYLAVADGVVYAGLTRINGAAGLNAGGLSALHAATGRQLWQVPVAGGVDLAPSTAPGVVYTGSNNGALDAWRAGTGTKLWSFSAAALIGTNIAVTDGIVYFGSNDNHVYAVTAQPPAGSAGSSPAGVNLGRLGRPSPARIIG